ncbi:hypothetical protein [Nitrosopumilus maritimus]|uniref:hypothetical protein n=1 Tax=Nitrosopumilus maritimus TaxID=338192 RepID=UPI000159B13D|nr:hypothetical protein [Nitrosopumilus maritimus]
MTGKIMPLRCTHLTVHTVMCMYCGMVMCSDCKLKHNSIHVKNGDKKIPESEFED